MEFFDAHIHVTDKDYAPYSDVLLQTIRNNPITVMTVSMDETTARKELNLHKEIPEKILPFIGLHPWSTPNTSIEEFEKYLRSVVNQAVGIGEIGLDRKYVASDGQYRQQIAAFKMQLDMAEEYEKPVSVHSRGSHEEVIAILSTYSLKKVLLHWFSGTLSEEKKVMEHGYYVSFGPTVIYSKKSKNLAENALREQILTETDGPVRYGACFEGKIAFPTFLPSIILSLSTRIHLSFEETAELVKKNSLKYLGRN